MKPFFTPSIFAIICILLLGLSACDLEPVEPGSDANKFITAIGGNGSVTPDDILVTADSGYVVVGNTTVGSYDAYIAKLKKNGELDWEREYGGAQVEYARSVVQTSNGGFIFCGSTRSFSNSEDVYVVGVDSGGGNKFDNHYGSADSMERAVGIFPQANGDYLIAYETYLGVGFETTNFLRLMRINSNGVMIWRSKGLTTKFNVSEIIKTSDGKLVAVGSGFSGSTGTTSYVLKLNEDGTEVWPKLIASSNAFYARDVVELPDKSLIVAGTETIGSNLDFKLVAFTHIGGDSWEKQWGGAKSDGLASICLTADMEVAVMGSSGSFSGQNEIYWSKRKSADGSQIGEEQNYAGHRILNGDMELCHDRGFIICAWMEGDIGTTIIKTDANGRFE